MELITGPYLCGQWPREPPRTQHTCMTDKATQTPGCWTDWTGLKKHRRSLSWSSADHQREITRLCLQVRQSVLGVQRNAEKDKEAATQCQTKLHPMSVSSASVSKPSMCRLGSVNDSVNDSINHELESVFVTDSWAQQQERELQDGRCAPVPHHHSGDPHTPSTEMHLCSHGNHSLHVFFSAGEPQDARNPCRGGRGFQEDHDDVTGSSSPLPLLVSSPKPNNSFVFKRVPPEGCEKIRVFEETASHGFPVISCPDKNRVSFIPTGAGPFCPVRTQTSQPAPLRLQARLPERSHCRAAQPSGGPSTATPAGYSA
ncbi:glucocorticoid-induced transcript 1 protein isoform X2 [Brachyhypopomus gauderio]